jgi:hypothetical protein
MSLAAFGTRCVLTGCLVLCLCGAASNDDGLKYDIDIPQLTVDEALNQLAQQTGVQLLFPFDLVKTLDANPVVGRYTLVEALEILLRDTGLSGGLTGSRVITISREAPTDNEEEVMLTQTDNNSPSRRRGLIGALAAIFSVGAGAQEAVDGSDLLEEIIVTAQKREQSLQEVPVSIAVFDADLMNSLNASDFSDFADIVPGMTFATTGAVGSSNYFIRGIGQVGQGLSPTTAVYLDETPLQTHTLQGSSQPDPKLFDVARMEVLRGPQGYCSDLRHWVGRYESSRINPTPASSKPWWMQVSPA